MTMMQQNVEHAPAAWRVGVNRMLHLDQPRILGILNVTTDSFSDGGRYSSAQEAADAALRMRDEGACMIDIGGESTRPGAAAISAEEQIRRTAPVIELLRQRVSADELLISIDTTQSAVARAALDSGADVINDVSAGRDDPEILALAASRQCGLILMHRLAPPREDSYSTDYRTSPDYGGDVVDAVGQFLLARCQVAIAAGVAPDSIVIDPGLGFGKSVAQNYELIGRSDELLSLGYPLLSAASRKSFVGSVSNVQEPAMRLAGTLAVSVAHALAGVRLFRVHDVEPHRQALAVALMIARQRHATGGVVTQQ